MFHKLLIPGFIATVAALLVVFYMDKEYSEISQYLAKQAQIEEDLRRADQVEAKRIELAQKYESFPQDAGERLKVFLPEKIDPLRLMIDIEAVAKRNGLVAAQMITEEQKDDSSPMTTVIVGFEMTATYAQLRIFLDELEKSLLLRKPVSLSIAQSSTQDSLGAIPVDPILKFQVKFESYSYSK